MRKKRNVPWTVSVIHLLIPGTTFIPISQRFSAIMRRNCQAMCGSLFAGEIQTFFGPYLASSIPNLVICQGTSLPIPIHFEFGSSTTLGWREWVDNELSNTGSMGLLQRVGVLKAIVSSHCLSNFRDLFNLHHLVRRWCTTTHTFFFSCSEVTVTLVDVANQLLLPISDDVDLATLEISPKEEAVEAELKNGMSGNAKLSYWVSSSSKFSVAAHRAAFVMFWLCKFVFRSHPHYAMKPLYFR